MKNQRELNLNSANERQRFSIRKLSIGAASVLLGTSAWCKYSNSAR